MALAKIVITLKEGILDPQGQIALRALRSLGYDEVRDLRIGKYMELVLDDSDGQDEHSRIRDMCEKLLTNPIIEDFKIELEESK